MPGVHGLYWLLPLAAVLAWTGTLLGLLLWWIIDDNHKRYQIGESTVVYISDVGAAHLALFIPGTACTFVFYSLSLVAERWLRHLRRLPGALKMRERWLGIITVVLGSIGGLALLLLSIFNAFAYPTAHWSLTAVFVVCVALSAIAQTLETMSLERNHVDRKHLRRVSIWKLCVVSFAITGAIVFGSTYAKCSGTNDNAAPTPQCNTIESVAAAFEWLIAFIFDVYLFTLVLDLYPAKKTRGHHFDQSLVDHERANDLRFHPRDHGAVLEGQVADSGSQTRAESSNGTRGFGDEDRTLGSQSEEARRRDEAFEKREKEGQTNVGRGRFGGPGEEAQRPGAEAQWVNSGRLGGGNNVMKEVS